MAIYLIFLICIYIVSAKETKRLTEHDLVFFTLLTIVSGFRYDVGTDYFSYVRYFERIESGLSSPAEPGFNIISSIVSTLNMNSQVVFLVFSILTMFFIYKGVKYYADDKYFYKPVFYIIFIIFTFIPSLNGMRQALAAAIVLYASRFIIEKKFFRYIVWIFIAIGFHFSSIIFIAFYFVINRKYKTVILLSILFITFVIARLGLINTILEYILANYKFLDVGGYIDNYLKSSYNQREIQFGIVFYINFLVLVLFIFLQDRIRKDSKDTLVFNMFFLYVFSGVLSMGAPMLSRLTYYFSIYMAIYIPKFTTIFNKKSQKTIEYILVILYSALFLFIIIRGYLNPGSTDYIPYNYNFDIFNKEANMEGMLWD